ncbi:MAG: acetate uptake transporter [Syntrophomonadaceae bacterium]|nr:acetate uptake transporter [Syntrophomonadaceae bacterium]
MAKEVKELDLKKVEVSGHIQELVGNPSAIGLLGLAMVTFVASTQKLGWTTDVSAVIPWAIFLGALAQFTAGILDFKHNNTFGATAFCGYGFFWFAVAMSWMTQLGVFGAKAAEVFDVTQLGVGFLGYLIFTVIMTFGAMGANKVLFIIFFLIDMLFLGLSMSVLTGQPHGFWHNLAAWSELLIALTSFYGVAANVLNSHYKKVVLPVGKPFGPWV